MSVTVFAVLTLLVVGYFFKDILKFLFIAGVVIFIGTYKYDSLSMIQNAITFLLGMIKGGI
jgi:hypothetical protein